MSRPQPLVAAGTAAFRAASRLRGERAIHPRGRALVGTLTATGGAGTGVALLDSPGRYDVLVRVSRSAGLPELLPDVLGLAVRVLDAHGPGAHQDLLLDSTGPEPLLRRWPVPARRRPRRCCTARCCRTTPPGGRLLLGAPRRRRAGRRSPSCRTSCRSSCCARRRTGRGAPWGVVRTTGALPAPEGRRLR